MNADGGRKLLERIANILNEDPSLHHALVSK
jgi:hypothetical protein